MSTDCKSAVLNDVFWDRQQALYDMLNPVAAWITKLEADTPQLGVVVKVFAELTQHFDTAVKVTTAKERSASCTCCTEQSSRILCYRYP